MLKVRDEIDRYYITCNTGNFDFVHVICGNQENIMWLRNYNEQEKLEIKKKMVEIVNGNLPMNSMDIDEIKYLFIEYFKKSSDDEKFYQFLTKDISILHENIIKILNYLLTFEKHEITCDMLEKVIDIYPETKEIFYNRDSFHQLVKTNCNDITKLLEFMHKYHLEPSIDNMIYSLYQMEFPLSKNSLDCFYQYFVKYMDKCNLNQLYFIGSILPNEFTDEYFELLLEKEIFHKLQFTEWNNLTPIIIKNKEFQKKFLQYYSGLINSNFVDIIKNTGIDVLIQYFIDHEEDYSPKEIENIFEIIEYGAIEILNGEDFDRNVGFQNGSPILNTKQLLLKKDITYLWKIDAYYKNFTPILERYMINQLQNDDNMKLLDSIDSPLTNEYLSLINNKNPEVRKKLYTIFYDYYKRKLKLENNDCDHYVYQLFKKFVDGKHIYAISKIQSSIEMIAFLKMQYWQLDLKKLTKEQIKNINVKHIFKLERILCKFYQNLNDVQKEKYHLLLVKCYLIFGFDKAKIVLESIDKINELEHLFDTIDTRNIKYDETGNLILNDKFIRIYSSIFKNKIKNNDAYQLFPDIYKNFDELIKNLQKDNRTLPKIVKLYKEIRFHCNGYPPNYYRLNDQIIYIPNNEITNENLKWYETMKLRYISNIPKVSGKLNHYHYEMLDLDDPLTITVGKRTNCCFLLDGVSKTSLKHAMTKDNGRVFVVFNGNEVIAQSWVWRDGNIVCFDNVEAILNDQELSDCYVEAIQKIVMESKEKENSIERIKMITIGINEIDLKYDFTKKFSHITSEDFLTQFSPILDYDIKNNNIYSDAKRKQCVIYQEPNFEIEDNNHLLSPIYLDQRPSIEKNNIESNTDLFDIKLLLNSINYDLKLPLITDEELSKVKTVYYNKDWYLVINKDGSYYSNIYSIDPRAHVEYEKILETIVLEKEPVLVKK